MDRRIVGLSEILRTVTHLAVWCYAALLAIPLYYLVTSSFKDNAQVFLDPFGIPDRELLVTRPGNYREFESVGFQNYLEAWQFVFLDRALWNSFVVTVGALVLVLGLCIPAAYALARADSAVVIWTERYFSLGLLVPGFAALVPTVLLSIELGLFQTRLFLILVYPAAALPLSVILLTQFMRTIPPELEESAIIDGASQLQILRRIYIPIARPGIATVVILNFVGFWNEFLYALVVAGINPDVRTIQVAIPSLIRINETEFGVLAAGTIISLIPIYVLYIVLNRRMESALTEGAVKG